MGIITAILGLLTGPFGKLITYVLGIISVLGILGTVYLTIVHNAKREQAEKDQRAAMEQVIKNQNQFIADTKALLNDQKQITDDLNSQIKTIQSSNGKLDDFLNAASTSKDDRPSSSILKETIKQLQGN